MLTIGLKTDEQNRTIVSCKIDPSARARRLYIKNRDGEEVYSTEFTSIISKTIEIIVEDYGDKLVSIYPKSKEGILTVELQEKVKLIPATWEVAATATQEYPINNNEWNSPQISSVTVTPGNKYFGRSNLYVLGKSTVKVTVTVTQKSYAANADKIGWTIDGKEYTSGAKSDVLKTVGPRPIEITVTDTRGYIHKESRSISVSNYVPPSILPISSSKSVSVDRCDSEGNITKIGENLFVSARINFVKFGSPSNDNKGTLKYRIKEVGGEWVNADGETLLSSATQNATVDEVIPGCTVDQDKAYVVELIATDTIGDSSSMIFSIPSRAVFMERNGERNSISFFGEITENDSFEVYNKAIFHGGVEIDKEWHSLELREPFSPCDCGRAGGGVWYRLGVDGKVTIAFGVSCVEDISVDSDHILADLPDGIVPPRPMASICAAGIFRGSSLPELLQFKWGNYCTVWLNSSGNIRITNLVKNFTASNTNYINAIDGYISYYI